ncbi:MAG: hypothetical protein IPL28_19310 [Chloroflexi bacterium]|nr:hypothetical protein [Chloroflexota bacterium]
MQSLNVQRLRITFSKTGATRFIGHLDAPPPKGSIGGRKCNLPPPPRWV